MYVSHFSVYRKQFLDRIGGFRSQCDAGGQDLDLAFRFVERTDKIVHIPKVLYHWNAISTSSASGGESKRSATEMVEQVVQDMLARRGIPGRVQADTPWRGTYEVVREVVRPETVSIVIAAGGDLERLRGCLASIGSNSADVEYEIVIVVNGDRDQELARALGGIPYRLLRDDGPYNRSRLINIGARAAEGAYLLFLHDDVEVLRPGWLTAMMSQAQRPEVGAVGARVVRPDGSLQHMGIVVPIGPLGQHDGVTVAEANGRILALGAFQYPDLVRNCSAVSDVCLMMRRDVFLEICGLDEERLPDRFSDVDVCLRLQAQGYQIVFTPHAEVHHLGSLPFFAEASTQELTHLQSTWRDVWHDDPYYPLTLERHVGFGIDFARPDSYRCMAEQPLADATVGELIAGRQIAQGFAAERDGLCGLSIRFSTGGRLCRGTVRLRLTERGGKDVHAEVSVEATTIPDGGYQLFLFDPIENSEGKAYSFCLDFQPAGGECTLTVWRSAVTDPAMGPWLENNESQEGTLTFELLWPMPRFRATSVRPDVPISAPADVQEKPGEPQEVLRDGARSRRP
jgi:GT2 family glycosyltransferase